MIFVNLKMDFMKKLIAIFVLISHVKQILMKIFFLKNLNYKNIIQIYKIQKKKIKISQKKTIIHFGRQ